MAHGLGQELVEETLRLRVIAKPPRTLNEPAPRNPQRKRQSCERNHGDNQAQDPDTQWPPVVDPHQGRHEQKAQEAEAVDTSRKWGERCGGARVLEDHRED